jgi:hypothetical protein
MWLLMYEGPNKDSQYWMWLPMYEGPNKDS